MSVSVFLSRLWLPSQSQLNFLVWKCCRLCCLYRQIHAVRSRSNGHLRQFLAHSVIKCYWGETCFGFFYDWGASLSDWYSCQFGFSKENTRATDHSLGLKFVSKTREQPWFFRRPSSELTRRRLSLYHLFYSP